MKGPTTSRSGCHAIASRGSRAWWRGPSYGACWPQPIRRPWARRDGSRRHGCNFGARGRAPGRANGLRGSRCGAAATRSATGHALAAPALGPYGSATPPAPRAPALGPCRRWRSQCNVHGGGNRAPCHPVQHGPHHARARTCWVAHGHCWLHHAGTCRRTAWLKDELAHVDAAVSASCTSLLITLKTVVITRCTWLPFWAAASINCMRMNCSHEHGL